MARVIVKAYLVVFSMMVWLHHGARRELVDQKAGLKRNHLQNASYDSIDKDPKKAFAREVLTQLMDVGQRDTEEDKKSAQAIREDLTKKLEPSKAQLLTSCPYYSLSEEHQDELAEGVKKYLEDLNLFDICGWLTTRNLQRALEAHEYAANQIEMTNRSTSDSIDHMHSNGNCNLFTKVWALLNDEKQSDEDGRVGDIKAMLGYQSIDAKRTLEEGLKQKNLFSLRAWLTVQNLAEAIDRAKSQTQNMQRSVTTVKNSQTPYLGQAIHRMSKEIGRSATHDKTVKSPPYTQAHDPANVLEEDNQAMKVAGGETRDKDSPHTGQTIGFWLVAIYCLW